MGHKPLWAFAALLSGLAATAADCPLSLAASPDYRHLVAWQPEGSPPVRVRWIRNGVPWTETESPQSLLLHLDGSLDSAEGVRPASPGSAQFVAGRFGRALALAPGGAVPSYPRTPALNLDEGTVELWIASREDGTSATYTRDGELMRYAAPNGDWLGVRQAGRDGTLYLGGTVGGQWQSAYSARASMRPWKAGEWHHVAATWSASANTMRFFVDGVMAADSNERRYRPPAAGASVFMLGSADFWIDEVRLFARALTQEEVRARAGHNAPPRHAEIWLDLATLETGDSVALSAESCTTPAFVWEGVPVFDASPPSTILPSGTTSLDLSVRTSRDAQCRWALARAGAPAPLPDAMTAFRESGGRTHTGRIDGLSADPTVVNSVVVRCSHSPEFAYELRYRSLGTFRQRFPRIGNLWGSGGMLAGGHDHAARIDGYFGAEFSPADIRRLRELHPEILILTSINTVENRNLPEDYYLHDTRGNKIEVWPGTYRLNLTKPYVAEYQARFAYQKMLDSGLLYDGVFFDNFFTTQAWLKADIHGTAVQLDADEDGKPDDPAWLDAEWRKGVFLELSLWRQWMPHAAATGHLPRPPTQEIGDIFNGGAILFASTHVIEGRESFQNLWDSYMRWWEVGRSPGVAAVESSPANQLAYGYGYSLLRDTPAPTQEFARTQYRHMRFGLATALMNDGYFWFDYGDILHGIDWWYDEYDFDLGFPLGQPERAGTGEGPPPELLRNGTFEEPLSPAWVLSVTSSGGAAATVERSTDAAEGQFSALVTISNAGAGTGWHVDFNQRDRSLRKGGTYVLSFHARADRPREIRLSSQKGSPDWRSYGLSRSVSVDTEWRSYSVSFEANETASDARIQFFLGDATGRVWLDGISLKQQPPAVWQRDFTNGRVILNGTASPVTLSVGAGFRRFSGEQAPRWQYEVDDDGDAFNASPEWKTASFDTGQWKSRGPYYHHWGSGCRTLDGRVGEARWELGIQDDDRYRIEAWWASPPEQSQWTREAVYEVVADGRVVASATLDQTQPGDRWHFIADVELRASEKPYVRLRNAGAGRAVADALTVSSRARRNDGAPVTRVTVGAFDGLMLQRVDPVAGSPGPLP